MAVTASDLERAEARAQRDLECGHVLSARYDGRRRRVIVRLSADVEVTFPAASAEGLAGASHEDLEQIEISPTRLGLHWPRLDADLYIPALLQGALGSKRWMAAQLGAAGGRVRSAAKTAAARDNGRKGGRPPSAAADTGGEPG